MRSTNSKRLSFVSKLIALSGTLVMSGPAMSQQGRGGNQNLDKGFAVVELFTSQGCSSCPAADENLAAISKQAEKDGNKVVTLSFHVDYWNQLGWTDPYSTADATRRQRLYAGVHGSQQVYTPQMVVNGTAELLGSNRAGSRATIAAALKRPSRSSLELKTTIDGRKVGVDWKVDGLQAGDLVNIALVQKQAADTAESGENSGRLLKHVNVVREFHVVEPTKEEGVVDLTVPDGVEPANLHVVVFLQSSQNADIHAVATRDISP